MVGLYIIGEYSHVELPTKQHFKLTRLNRIVWRPEQNNIIEIIRYVIVYLVMTDENSIGKRRWKISKTTRRMYRLVEEWIYTYNRNNEILSKNRRLCSKLVYVHAWKMNLFRACTIKINSVRALRVLILFWESLAHKTLSFPNAYVYDIIIICNNYNMQVQN